MFHIIKELIRILWKMYKDGDFVPYDKVKRGE